MLRYELATAPSTFLMHKTQFCVKNKDCAELCRITSAQICAFCRQASTSTEEGIGICYAVLEKLVKLKAFAIFATHFLDLAALDVSYSTVENLHFPSQITYVNGQEQLSPSHRLHRGPYNGPLYGLELVELSTFPSAVIDAAREMGERLHEEASDKRAMSADTMLHQALERHALRLRQVVLSRNVASAESLSKFVELLV
ncbi:unnamed protein product [Heligmosomoides polygyrus]|uniref:DNA_MISMATCH_REPAIR_2 domain-containing protein n=1 Tax=Heligmosomoides polygyrus TaxID=6339 RepID=A0A183GQ71_HELPZ|nr:unnamed protein product [Heligmosomoides polygyrus]